MGADRLRFGSIIDLYDRALAAAAHLLDIGDAHARATGMGEADFLGWRLIDDMAPLSFQLTVVIDFSMRWPARIADLEVPGGVLSDAGIEDLQAAIEFARSYLADFPLGRLEARAGAELTHRVNSDIELTLSGGDWLTVFALTNIHFHLSAAYCILRSRGVPLQKPDLFARDLGGFGGAKAVRGDV